MERPTVAGPKQKGPFEVEIEGQANRSRLRRVLSAQEGREGFSSGRSLGADVGAGDGIWTYAVHLPIDASGGAPYRSTWRSDAELARGPLLKGAGSASRDDAPNRV